MYVDTQREGHSSLARSTPSEKRLSARIHSDSSTAIGRVTRPTRIVHERTGSVRLVLVPDFSTITRFGSVRRKIRFPGSPRFRLRLSDASWLGPFWFGSVPRPVPAGSRIQRFGLVRFGQFGSVYYLFLIVQFTASVCSSNMCSSNEQRSHSCNELVHA